MKAIFITVRTGSKRFLQKCLKEVAGKKAIERVIGRAKRSRKADVIVLCTTWLPEDQVLCDIAWDNLIRLSKGSAEDKLVRWEEATEKFKVDFFVTFDGDDLLCDPELADLAFEQHDRTGADFIEAPNVPTGAFTYGIATTALNKVCEIKGTRDTEMMVPYFKLCQNWMFDGVIVHSRKIFKVEQLENIPEDLQRFEIRMTMDYPDDLKFFDNIYKHFGDTDFTLRDVIAYLDANPEVIKINQYLQERYLENQHRLTGVILK